MRGAPRYWFPQTLIRRDVLGRMLLVGAASAACERPCSPRCWDGFGESSPLRTSTSIHLSVHFFRDNEPTSSLAVWACVAPPSVMQHAVLLGRDSWMRFNTRSYRALPRRPHDNRVFGELTLSHHATSGVSAYLWETKFRIFSDHKALESIGKAGKHNFRVQTRLEFLTAFDYTLEYSKVSANGNADFLSRLPEPSTEHDRSGSTSLNSVEDGGVYPIKGLRARHSLLADSGCRLE